MANITLILIVLFPIAYLLYRLLFTNRSSRTTLHYAEPPCEAGWSPWKFGLDVVSAGLRADRQKRFPDYVLDRARSIGAYTWTYRIFGTRIVATHEPANIQALLATQFGTFDLGPLRRGMFWPMLGNGIFTQSQKEWKHSRDMMRPQFTREQVSDLELEERHVQNFMRALDARPADQSVVDLQDLFFRLTLDSATEFLLGESADSQLAAVPGYKSTKSHLHDIDFARAFDTGQMELATRARFGPGYWLYHSRALREATKQCNAFMDYYVQRALAKAPAEKHGKYVFLEALAEQTQDPLELRSQMMHILLAGRDTTASMLGWLFLLLSKDPARYKKLRDIVLEEFGTYEDPKEITFAKLKSCAFLQHCNNETLRMYPVVPVNARFAYRDTTLPVGGGKDGKSPVFVGKGSSVEYSVYVLHHRKDIWGEDADEFVPERWEGRKVGWEFVPFNG